MVHVVNDPESPVNVPQTGPSGQSRPAPGRWRFPERRPVLVVLLLWAIQFAAFSIDRLVRFPELEGGGTLAARLIVTAVGAVLSLSILRFLQKGSDRSFLARSIVAFLLALVAATIHAVVNVAVFLLILGPTTAEPLGRELALTLPPLVFFFSWVHLAVAVVLLSLTYGQEVVQKERRLAEVSGQLESLRQVRPDEADQPHLWVRDGAQKLRVDIADIDWIGAEGEYVRIHSHDRSWLERRSMAELERQLGPLGMVRVHRSAIANVQRIESFRRTESGALYVKLANGRELRVGKSYQPQVRKLVQPVVARTGGY